MAIFGSNSILPLDLASKITEKSKSVCAIYQKNDEQSPRKGGTGFLISKRLVLTVPHVVSDSLNDVVDEDLIYELDFNLNKEQKISETNFIEVSPYPWNDERANAVHNELANAYPTDAARLKILGVTGIPKAHLLQTSVPIETWRQALDVAASFGKVKVLLENVLSDLSVTGYHKKIEVLLLTDSVKLARLKFIDIETDIVVLELEQETVLSPLSLRKSHFAALKKHNVKNEELETDKSSLEKLILYREATIIIHHPHLRHKSLSLSFDGIKSQSSKFIEYFLDTTAGSSGAPVFNQSMDVIGIHYGGIKGADIDSVQANVGLSIDPVMERLKLERFDYIDSTIEYIRNLEL